jgi:hypothetical protein
LNHSRDPMLSGFVEAVAERKERIGRQYRSPNG